MENFFKNFDFLGPKDQFTEIFKSWQKIRPNFEKYEIRQISGPHLALLKKN